MKNVKILWVDDEIDLLKPHILFLEGKGYEVLTANNGFDAIDLVLKTSFDIIFLDENMPGMTGLETLGKIKVIAPAVPVVMITKSEEENIMDEAVGAKIADYLIKPVKPNQVLLNIKKLVENRQLVTRKTMADYQMEFGNIGQQINEANDYNDWINIYKKLVYWESELRSSEDPGMNEILNNQYQEANSQFSKFIKRNYENWFESKSNNKPLLSPNVIKSKVLPLIQKEEEVVLIIIDNLRLDQWRSIYPIINQYLNVDEDGLYYSILPTATQYSRNAIFSGLMPHEIDQLHPEFWLYDEEEGGKNLYEEDLLKHQLNRTGMKTNFFFRKIQNLGDGQKLLQSIGQIKDYQLSVIIYNFVDQLSHARTDREMIRELANDESAYRSLTVSWFEHSTLLDLMKELSSLNKKIILTTDHGTIRVTNPVKVVGDRHTSTNLRYKTGKNLQYNKKLVYEVPEPWKIHLPASHVTSKFIFAQSNDFFVYPKNYNYYVNYYKNTFQHGGISMQEMLIPLILLSPGQ